jgi:putative RecB family exonuclease
VTLVSGEATALPRHLSPSSTSTWEQCPLRFRYSRLDKIPEPSTDAQLIGTLTHEVLEHLYQRPADERTTMVARQIVKKLWDDQWAKKVDYELHLDDEALRRFRWQVWWCIEALWQIEDPKVVELAGIEQRIDTVINGVKFLGIIDRWQDNGDGTAKIGDYKTGKKPKKQYEGEKKFQLTVYKALVEDELDREVRETELLYLKDGIKWTYIPTADDVTQMKQTVVRVWDEVTTACNSGIFEARTSVLCGWCSYKNMCPAWQR